MFRKGVVILIGILCLTNAAYAAKPSPIVKHFTDQAQKHVERMLVAEDNLKAREASEWEEGEVAAYLVSANWAVYSALTAYVLDRAELPARAEDVVSAGYLSVWPENPAADWRPCAVVDATAPFSAGDLVLQVCPPSAYSFKIGVDTDIEVANSFELSIYGMMQGASDAQRLEAREGNKNWAAIPSDSVSMIGFYAEPASSTREKRAKRARAQEQGASK
ncbi:hypothetical protein IT575_05485 [bacterium]|nr:hypothetical protein [bacterium]